MPTNTIKYANNVQNSQYFYKHLYFWGFFLQNGGEKHQYGNMLVTYVTN